MFLSVFCLFYRVFKGSQGEKILGVFEVFLGVFEKTKEKKDRVALHSCSRTLVLGHRRKLPVQQRSVWRVNLPDYS